MDLERWEELMTVLQTGSLTAAADKLGYTLSGISRSMTALEKEMGFSLLYRGKKGVTATEECEQILPYVRELLFASQKLRQKAASVRGGEAGEIAIGTAYRHYYRWLTEVTGEYHARYPEVHFRIYNGTSTDFAQQLEKHQLDFGLISEREGEHAWLPICEDKLIALLPVDHPLARLVTIPLEKFTEEPYIATCPGMDIDSGRFFQKHGIVPNEQFSAMDIQATYAMVDAGMGISITNQINSLTGFSGICHREITPTENITIGWAYGKELSPVAEKFLEFVKDRLPGKSAYH